MWQLIYNFNTCFVNSNTTSLNYVGDNVMLVFQYESYYMSAINSKWSFLFLADTGTGISDSDTFVLFSE